ncbi:MULTISPECIES: hypothetical protein [unclassified Achromobacter]|uniref:hypothetical protein n=1 Tax=unclassified Achromobacter TaxID=2626865 RepID=UPI000B51B31F|nr:MULTISPECIES: hypothetical protein [unclassified Achromobacter]OWT80382.1 hypothetical protein CEY05_02950 [Achromobacter sp. HZ34]OWT82265.1 hypothetical protein CEY04_02950 [Achromobacter sp. HZ28]
MKIIPVLSLVVGIAGAVLSPLAHAETGKCVLEVNKKTYLDGTCEIKINDKQGSFSIGAGDKHRSKYFAYVNIDEDGAHGYWNETPDSSHAHSDLGDLKRDGACWVNATARVCAYKK